MHCCKDSESLRRIPAYVHKVHLEYFQLLNNNLHLAHVDNQSHTNRRYIALSQNCQHKNTAMNSNGTKHVKHMIGEKMTGVTKMIEMNQYHSQAHYSWFWPMLSAVAEHISIPASIMQVQVRIA